MSPDLIERLIIWILLVVSLSVHEWAHAWSAWKLGDDTAARLGRLTFNPMAHIDPVGTVLLPLLGVPFGWAKPVPVNPSNFRRGISPGSGMMITALAGPISNIVLATIGTAMLIGLLKFAPLDQEMQVTVLKVFQLFIVLNVVLAIFNMIPIPPLDGSKVADYLMPAAMRPAWERFLELGSIPLMVLILLPSFLFNVSLIGPVVMYVMKMIFRLVAWSI